MRAPWSTAAAGASLSALLLLGGCGGDEQSEARAKEGLTLSNTWCRATPQGVTATSCFLTVNNNSAREERLTGGASSAAENLEVHETFVDGNVMRMRKVDALTTPARGTVQLAPGSYVLRLNGLKAAAVAGGVIPTQLAFEQAGEQQILFPVRIEAASAS
jgi:copper(I)-binding protein